MSQDQQPQVITLDNTNSIQILYQYVEVAQKGGAFLLPESDLIKRSRDVLLNGIPDQEIDAKMAKNLLIQAVNKGQSKGVYTLDDASILHKICQFVSANIDAPVESVQSAQSVQSVQSSVPVEDFQDESLSDLSAPVPLKTPGPKVI